MMQFQWSLFFSVDENFNHYTSDDSVAVDAITTGYATINQWNAQCICLITIFSVPQLSEA